ncbi:MAG: trigger factor [Candidatus Liberibacter ctenarytainae]|uniref:Trigger factor n=1 Tax=Candidatus Liberibacter ctenarytainae TaxID=2020335 RepID=A0A937AMB0_9HYPH|nr:trigger factor [Candidatus Liberibacter ctenarytainae]
MQVIEKVVEGLKREIDVITPSGQLMERLDKRLKSAQSKAHIKGFRPGKVPLSHIKSLCGKSVLSEIIDEIIKETIPSVLSDRNERAAMQPKIVINEGDQEVVALFLQGSIDLKLTLSYEIIPVVEIDPFDDLQVIREVCEIDEKETNKQVLQIAEKSAEFEVKDEGIAAIGDRITVDYTLASEGTILKDHSKDNVQLIVGSEELLPETKDAFIGVKVGDCKEIEISLPENYFNKDVAGKTVVLNFSIKEISCSLPVVVNDDLAVRLGFESESSMRDSVSKQLKQRSEFFVRQKIKRQILDYLDQKYKCEIPQCLVENEYNNIIQQVHVEMRGNNQSLQDNDSDLTEEDRQSYKILAERRVRAGIVLGTIGANNNIQVTEDEMRTALSQQLRRFPGNEQKILEHFQKSADAIAALRAPIFEEKVIDYILGNVKITDKNVTIDDILSTGEED